MKNSVAELLGASISAGISIFGFQEALNYSGKSGMMPQAVTVLATLLSFIWFFHAAKIYFAGESKFAFKEMHILKLIKVLGGIFLYVLAVPYVGFFSATVVAVPALSYMIGYRNLKVSLATTGGFVLILYAVFILLLNVPLPHEAIIDVIPRGMK